MIKMEHHKPNFFPHTVIEIQNDELKLKEDGSNIQNNVGQNGNILANQYELVRNILRHLPMRDLLRCCKVVITTSLPYFGVKLSCVCLMFAYRKK